MSKNIVMQESGIDKRLTVDKLKTKLAGSGSRLWTPEDEILVDGITIHENGTVTAAGKHGIVGFDKAVVDVRAGASGATMDDSPHTGISIPSDLTISEGDEPRIMGTISKITTDTPGGELCAWLPEPTDELGILHVTKNGTYHASQYGYYAFKQITADVQSGGGGGGDDPTPGPVNGAESIQLEHGPLKISYEDGETIDFSYILVSARDIDGNFIDYVPFEELIFPVTVADFDESQWGEYIVNDLIRPVFLDPVKVGDIISTYTAPETVVTSVVGDVRAFLLPHTDNQKALIFGSLDSDAKIDTARKNGTYPGTTQLNNRGEINGEFYYYSIASIGGETIGWPWRVSAYQPNKGIVECLGKALLGGVPLPATQEIPIQWARPEDGKVLETSTTIFVEMPTNN